MYDNITLLSHDNVYLDITVYRIPYTDRHRAREIGSFAVYIRPGIEHLSFGLRRARVRVSRARAASRHTGQHKPLPHVQELYTKYSCTVHARFTHIGVRGPASRVAVPLPFGALESDARSAT